MRSKFGQIRKQTKVKKICKDQELNQSEPKSSPQNQNGKITKITNGQNTGIAALECLKNSSKDL